MHYKSSKLYVAITTILIVATFTQMANAVPLTEKCIEEEPAWHNACGGAYVPSESNQASKENEYLSLNATRSAIEQAINSVNHQKSIPLNIDGWRLHSPAYRFLPEVNGSSHANLRKWHQALQLYVGAFQFLRNKEHVYERTFNVKRKSDDLKNLLENALRVLCDVETALNVSTTAQPLKVIGRVVMKNKLNAFRDNKPCKNAVNDIDAMFVTAKFNDMLKGMKKSLKIKLTKMRRQLHKQHNTTRGIIKTTHTPTKKQRQINNKIRRIKHRKNVTTKAPKAN